MIIPSLLYIAKKVITYLSYPTNKNDDEFVKIAKSIEEKILDLAKRIKMNEI